MELLNLVDTVCNKSIMERKKRDASGSREKKRDFET